MHQYLYSGFAKTFVNELFTQYKSHEPYHIRTKNNSNIDEGVEENVSKYNKVQGSNYDNIKNLKIEKSQENDTYDKNHALIISESANSIDSYSITKKGVFNNKANSLTNSNYPSNPSSIYKSESIHQSNLMIKKNLNISKCVSNKYVISFLIWTVNKC